MEFELDSYFEQDFEGQDSKYWYQRRVKDRVIETSIEISSPVLLSQSDEIMGDRRRSGSHVGVKELVLLMVVAGVIWYSVVPENLPAGSIIRRSVLRPRRPWWKPHIITVWQLKSFDGASCRPYVRWAARVNLIFIARALWQRMINASALLLRFVVRRCINVG